MENTPPVPAAKPSPGRFLWRTGALLVVLAILFISSTVSLRGERSRQSDTSARLLLDSMVMARQVYLLRHLDDIADDLSATSANPSISANPAIRRPPARRSSTRAVASEQRKLIADLEQLAERDPGPGSLRRLAIMQRYLDDPRWSQSLARLRIHPGAPPPLTLEGELADWRLVLAPHMVKRAQVPALADWVAGLKLGWYEHIALETLYRNAGMEAEARRAASEARRSSTRLITMFMLMVGLGVCGFGIGVGLLIFTIGRRRRAAAGLPLDPVSPLLETAPPTSLTPQQADALYVVFLLYLVTFAVLRLGISLPLRLLLGNGGRLDPTANAILSVCLMLLAVGVPLAALVVLGRRVGLRLRDIGFRTQNAVTDIAWGVGGYMVALPLLWATAALSSWLFRGFESPTNPAVTEFAATHSALFHALLFFQAAAMAPFSEETMFRGVFYRALSPRMGSFAALLVASGVFAILHPQLPLGFLAIFLLGALFNMLYALRGSLLPSMTAHALNNGMIFLLLTLLLGD